MLSSIYIPAFWYKSNNFGDALAHYLISKLSKKTPVWCAMHDPCEKVVVTGSILNNPIENAIIWGCGVAFSSDIITPKAKILAVRGPQTAQLLARYDIDFSGPCLDPVFVLPKIFSPVIKQSYKLGIIPHYVDLKDLYDRLAVGDGRFHEYEMKVIDIMQPVEDVVKDILSCERIISSSLHGLGAALAYKGAAQWVKFSNNVGGDDFKFLDLLSSVQSKRTQFVDLRGENLTFNRLLQLASNDEVRTEELIFDVDQLLSVCPFYDPE